jgi:regulator of protease activity HflC (stomatin/prohibitin superfamily)
LITQTLDPMLSAFFRDVAHHKTMLELLHERDVIQAEARDVLRKKFREFDIECVDVLIGKPDPKEGDTKIETLLEQLRLRQLSVEQIETYERQRAAADKQRILNEAQAQAKMQTDLTNARVQVQIAESHGEADLARARKQAEQTVVIADAELARSRRAAEQTVVTAEADSKQRELAGRGEAQKIAQVGLSEATVMMRRIASFRDPKLYAISILAEQLSKSTQPLVPQRVFVAGGGSGGGNGNGNGAAGGAMDPGAGLFGTLIGLLVAEKSGFAIGPTEAGQTDPALRDPALADMEAFADRVTKKAIATLEGDGQADQK